MKPQICIIAILLTLLSFSQENWKLKENKDNVQVFTKDVVNSKIKQYRAITTVDQSLEKVVNTILDADKIKEWNYKTTESYLIKKESDSIHYIYMYNDLPWPVLNRDFISKLTVTSISEKSIKIIIEPGDNSLVPEKDGVIRMSEFKGYWLIESLNGKTKITQEIYGNPEGNLPSFFVNSTLVAAPYNTFLKLREILSK